MIVTSTKHGRTSREGFNLIRHLNKPENDYVLVASMGNSLAHNLGELVHDMELYRDASPSEAAFHHLTINPAQNLSREALIEAVNRVRLELDPEGTRPFGIVVHGKKRAELGGAAEHAHLILGHVNASGKALKDSWIKIRTERVARELEFAYGEPATLGRHHKTVLKVLRKTEPEVAIWLEAAHGLEPAKPNSALSPRSRSRALQHGVALPAAKAMVRQVWTDSRGLIDFRTNLEAAGYNILKGDKPGVFIVANQDGHVIGAADRLLRLRRIDFRKLMEASFGPEFQAHTTNDPAPRPEAVRHEPIDRPESREAAPAPRAIGGESGNGRRRARPERRPDPAHAGPTGTHLATAGNPGHGHVGNRPQAVARPGSAARRNALKRLHAADVGKLNLLIEMAVDLTPAHSYTPDPPSSDEDYVPRTDLWGIGILKPR